MTIDTFLDLPLMQIDLPADRARSYDAAAAEALAAVIQTQGLINPITVRQNGDRYTLVTGFHRYHAFELNGSESIPARLSSAGTDAAARLEEVMENLGRANLTALDRCQHLYELKQVWEADKARPLVEVLTDAGGKRFPTPDDKPEVFGFAAEIAEKIGLSKRAINMAVKIWVSLDPDVRTRLVGTDLARKQTELKALSELRPAKQAKVLDLIEDPDSDASNVSSALVALDGAAADLEGRKFSAFRDKFRALPDSSFELIVLENQDRVIAALKRAGKI